VKYCCDFGNYRLFTSGQGDAFIEGGMRGDAVGAIRNATLNGVTVRQRLRAHSDAERSRLVILTSPAVRLGLKLSRSA
jgi:hypothetical protein